MARLDELERKFEENPRRYFAPLANEYRKAGDAAKAAELCRSQLPEVPGHISGHIVLGQALLDSGDFPGARAALETALALDPENIVALRFLGDIARNAGDTAEAERWYSRTLEADPYNEAATQALQALRADDSAAVSAAPMESAAPDALPPSAEAATEPASHAALEGFEPTAHDVEPALQESPVEPAAEDVVAIEERPSEMTAVDEPEQGAEGSAADEPSVAEPGPTAALPEPALVEDVPVEDVTGSAEFAGDLAISAASEAADEGDLDPQPADAQPVPADEAMQAEERVMESAAPFVTETMADLYLEQGYPHEALELLLQLAEQRPEDERLRQKVAHIESVIAARRDAAVAAARAERAETAHAADAAAQTASAEAVQLPVTDPPEAAVEEPAPPDAPFDVAVAEVDSSAFVDSQVTEAALAFEIPPFLPADEAAPTTVREMFARMDRARPRPASSVTPRPLSRLRSDFAPMPDPGATASESPDDPFAFPDAPRPEHRVPRTSGPQPTFNPSTADIDDFEAWLRGLKGS